MTIEELYQILITSNLPVAYDHFVGDMEPPFILYKCEPAEQFKADDKVYKRIYKYRIDLVTDNKDPVAEEALEEIFANNDIPWDKDELYINDEKIYQITYYI